MLDRGSFWTPAAEPVGEFVTPGLRVTGVSGLHQLLLSGDPGTVGGALGTSFRSRVGFNDIAVGETYGAAVARDRTLIVSERSLGVAEGWTAVPGVAANVMDDAWLILDFEGDGLDDLVGMATTIHRGDPTPSSALLFASIPCIAYRRGSPTILRLHVERPLAPFLLEWVRSAMKDHR